MSMELVAQIFALIGAVFHFVAFVGESLLFERPQVHNGLFKLPTEDVRPMRLWAFNVGFYNLFLGTGALVGVILWWAGNDVVGRTLVVYTMAFMFLAGCVLFLSDRLALGRARGTGVTGAIGQAGPPLIACIALALS